MPSLWDSIGGDDDDQLRTLMSQQRRQQYTPRRAMTQQQIDEYLLREAARPDEIEYISMGSGSSGNCSYIGIRGGGGVLIDAGVDAAKVVSELERNGIDIDSISGIILTHDHSDHVRYAYTLLRKYRKMLLYCTPRTLNGILRRHNISKRIKEHHKPIYKEFEFEAGPLLITPFEVSHDGTDNVGFSILIGERRFVVATDMGKITERADYYIRQANHLMIESNYDDRMLQAGRYPEYLKARIRSAIGHLDNEVTAAYLAEIWTAGLTDIYLCHLSEDNNRPEIAIEAVRRALTARGITVGDASGSSEALKAQVQLAVLPRYDSSPLYIHRL